MSVRTCRVCGCTDGDCRGCIERTGAPCHWVEEDLCSACSPGYAGNAQDRGLAELRAFCRQTSPPQLDFVLLIYRREEMKPGEPAKIICGEVATAVQAAKQFLAQHSTPMN